MFWGDIAVKYPQLLSILPKDMIAVPWDYDAKPSYESIIKPYRDAGLRVVVAPGAKYWNQVWPNLDVAYVNIRNFVLIWAMVAPLWYNRRLALRCLLSAAVAYSVAFGLWMALVVHSGFFADYKYLFSSNQTIKPRESYWPFVSFWWSFHGGLWVDQILIPLVGLIVLGAALAWWNARARKLLLDPVFGASVLAVAGIIAFMACQNHPQPRYFAVAAFFCFFVVAQGAGALLDTPSNLRPPRFPQRILGCAVIALAILAAAFNGLQTLNYAAHPEYTFVDAARRLTQYIDANPNGKRLLVSSSGDEITLITRLPALCDDFGTQDLALKLARYQPGWFAAWNDLDPGTLADIHQHFSLEQAASFRAFDDTDRNILVLFKLHPLAAGQERDPEKQNLQIPLPGDKIDINVE